MNEVPLELSLVKRIDDMKRTMVETANRTGINSHETIKCSQELDILLNLYMKHYPVKQIGECYAKN